MQFRYLSSNLNPVWLLTYHVFYRILCSYSHWEWPGNFSSVLQFTLAVFFPLLCWCSFRQFVSNCWSLFCFYNHLCLLLLYFTMFHLENRDWNCLNCTNPINTQVLYLPENSFHISRTRKINFLTFPISSVKLP